MNLRIQTAVHSLSVHFLLLLFLLPSAHTPSLPPSLVYFSDRFRTPVNVLGDCYGAGIVYHHSKKYLPSSADHAHSAPQPPTASTPTRDNITGMEDSLPAELNQLSSTDGCPRSQGEQSSHARDSGLPSSCSYDSRPAQAAVDIGGTEILLKEGTNQPGGALNREDNEDTCL